MQFPDANSRFCINRTDVFVQLGVYSFGSLARDPDTGTLATTAQSTRNLFEAVKLADDVGLDYFGHMRQFIQMDIGPISHRDYLTSIELLGKRVKPLIDAELGPEPADLRDTVTSKPPHAPTG
jgi:hypothetical protein